MKRRKKIIFRKLFVGSLGFGFFIILFFVVGLFITASNIESDSKKFNEHVICDFCEKLVAELKEEDVEKLEEIRQEKIANAKGIIYLTFDDGPSEYTNALLDVLEKYDTKATFFVTGRGDDAVLKREFDDGHAIGLHTFSHNYAAIYNSMDAFFDDLSAVSDRVKRVIGIDAKMIRFPGGSSNTVSKRYDGGVKIMTKLTAEVLNRGYQYFDWNVDSDDAGRAKTSDDVFKNVTSRLSDGPNVVLQHDVKAYSVEAVERIIEFGNENNYVFEPLSMAAFSAHHNVNN